VHTIDLLVACAAVLLLIALAAVLARQRYMLRVAGAVPMAIQVRGHRWVYGVGRYVGGDLRWYRAIGIGTRPTVVLRRADMRVLSHRHPEGGELASLPATYFIVECTNGPDGYAVLGLGEGVFTGFVAWLEASAPLA
jgi:hypothetical protein